MTHNQGVAGSSPAGPTDKKALACCAGAFFCPWAPGPFKFDSPITASPRGGPAAAKTAGKCQKRSGTDYFLARHSCL